MSKLTVTVTLAVIFLVTLSDIVLATFSDAHSPLDPTENDITDTQSDVILLPSQKLESKPKPVKDEPNPNLQVEPENFHTVDLTRIPIRPESGQSHERIVPLSFRVPLGRGHRCRHGHRLFRHREAPEREISIGDDTIVEKEKEKFGSDFGPRPMFPVRLVRIHHRKPRFGNMEMAWDDEMSVPRIHRHRHFARVEQEEKGEEKEKEYYHHHRHHQHYHHYPHYEFKERNGDRGNNGLFVKIRKFLHGF